MTSRILPRWLGGFGHYKKKTGGTTLASSDLGTTFFRSLGASSRPRPVCFSRGFPVEDPLLHFGGASLLPLTVPMPPPLSLASSGRQSQRQLFGRWAFSSTAATFSAAQKIPATIFPSFSAKLPLLSQILAQPEKMVFLSCVEEEASNFPFFSSPRSLHFGKRGREQSNICQGQTRKECQKKKS